MACLALVVLGGAIAYGVFAHADDLPPVPQVRAAYDTLRTIGDNDVTADGTRHHLQPTRDQGDGVVVDEVPDDGALVMMAGFFDGENQVRLVRRDGSVVRTWPLDYFEHFPDPDTRPCDLASPLRVDTHGMYATPDGDVVVNYEYCGSVRLDACGGVQWALDERTHHSVAPAEAGGFWMLGRDHWRSGDDPDRFPAFTADPEDRGNRLMLEDTILRVDEAGVVQERISVPELLRDAGLEAVLTASGPRRFPLTETLDGWELVHANKVAELPSDVADAYPQFRAGDLVVSLRTHNLLVVVDPETREVRWHQTGPWLRQHDPEFGPDGRISVFNNNVYVTAYDHDQTVLSTPRTTNIMAVDPSSGDTEVVFGDAPGQEMLSVVRGDHQLLDDGGMLITEFDAGRVLEVDADGQIVWSYVNAYDDQHVAEVTNAALHPAGWFRTDWSSCDT